MNNQYSTMDILNVLSFGIGVENLKMNASQSDIQNVISRTDQQTQVLLTEIHTHLEEQDRKLDYIIERLNKLIQ